jgi:hypothetical protein
VYAMQYEITLPADYDMGIIRRRVKTRGHALDGLPGLVFKAYVIRERGIGGSPVNQYAPFYVWDDTDAMTRFLVGGGGFGGIVEDFGRPAVRHWTGVASLPGPARTAVPRAASRHTEPVPYGADPAAAVARALGELRERTAAEGVHSAALAFDPRDWELVRFTLWKTLPEQDSPAEGPEPDSVRYEVLHLSAPAAPWAAVRAG